jgi:hypothetical protein
MRRCLEAPMPESNAHQKTIVVLTPIITAVISMVGTLGAGYFGIVRSDKANIQKLTNQLEQFGQAPNVRQLEKISLTILDDKKEPVRKALISLSPPPIQGLTDDSGTWTSNDVPAGTYSLSISTQIASLPPHLLIDSTVRPSAERKQLSTMTVLYNIEPQQPK